MFTPPNISADPKTWTRPVTLETRLARYAARAFRYSFFAASVFRLYACEGTKHNCE